MPSNSSHAPSSDLLECIQRDTVQLLHLPARPSIHIIHTLHNPYSEIHILHIQSKSLDLRAYVKIPRASTSGKHIAQERLATEFKIMQQLHQGAGAATQEIFSDVARPLGYYPEHLALATFEAASHTLRQHYRSAARWIYKRRSRELLLEEVKNVGRWLRNFQQHTLQGTGPFDADQLVAYIKIRLDLLTKIQHLNFPPLLADKIIAQVRKYSNSIHASTHQIAGRHNDFASHNILCDNGKIWIIDFSMYDTGSTAHDPAFFWLDMEMLKSDPSYCSSFLIKAQEAFLAHYGKISPEDISFQLIRCQYSLNRILTLHDNALPLTPEAVYRRSVVKSCMAWIKEFSCKA